MRLNIHPDYDLLFAVISRKYKKGAMVNILVTKTLVVNMVNDKKKMKNPYILVYKIHIYMLKMILSSLLT